MKTTFHHFFLASLLVLSLISCKEDKDNGPSFTYNPRNSEITSPTVWKATDDILVDCVLEVKSTLRIEPGAVVKFTQNGLLNVGKDKNGAIIANGTAEKPIRFTTTQFTQEGADAFTAQKGFWYGLFFGERNTANTSSFKHCIIEGAGKKNTPAVELYKTNLTMEACTVRNCAGMGIKADPGSSFSSFSSNELSQCDDYLLAGTPEALVDMNTTNTFTPTNNKGIAILGGDIAFDCTLTKQAIPYTVLGNIYVDNAELTIEKGTTLQFDPATALLIGKSHYAALIAEGTQTEPIHFTSSSTNPVAGDWQGLIFSTYNAKDRTNINYAIIEYAGKPSNTYQGAVQVYSPIRMENTTIRESRINGVACGNNTGFVSFNNNTVEKCALFPVSIDLSYAKTLGTNNTYTDNSYNYINLTGTNLTDNAQLPAYSIPYICLDGISINGPINKDITLTFSPGCVIAFSMGTGITVSQRGILIADGNALHPITFTSLPGDPSTIEWSGITIEELCSSGNLLNYCILENAGSNTDYTIGVSTSNATISNSTIRNSLKYGIYISGPAYHPIIKNNTFVNNQGDNIHYGTSTNS